MGMLHPDTRRRTQGVIAPSVGAACLVAFVALTAIPALAQSRDYSYDHFAVTYTVEPDTSVRVHEEITYVFNGEYHQAYRSISTQGTDGITDILLYEKDGKPLRYTPVPFDKTDPLSWGMYTVSNGPGTKNIEWYYDLANTTHTWVLEYTLHGALSFYPSHDELYWNLFSGLDAPIKTAEAYVVLPGAVTAPQLTSYVDGDHGATFVQEDDRTFHFTAHDINVGQPVTIAAGWQKGLIDDSAYWYDYWKYRWPIPVAIALPIIAFVFAVAYWFISERRRKKDLIVIAEYEPPRALPPAMADIVVHGNITGPVWSATIVDLAVRGFLRIERQEEVSVLKQKTTNPLLVVFGMIGTLFVFTAWVVVAAGMKLVGQTQLTLVVFILFMGLAVYGFFKVMDRFGAGVVKVYGYLLTRTAREAEHGLRQYERSLLEALFKDGSTFSTAESRQSSTRAQELYFAMKGLESAAYDETARELQIFVTPPERQYVWLRGLRMLVLGAVGAGLFFGNFQWGILSLVFGSAYFWLAVSVLLSAIIIAYAMHFKTRLNRDGEVLRQDWLGFKLYLETAERYRLQNLTPETFEKYLPYAMLFGIERKWASAFQGMTMPPPRWYGGTYAAGGFSTTGSAVFSASAFAGSFSASFASAFASSGASGGYSGGGGFAGGGGGGGGGGAS